MKSSALQWIILVPHRSPSGRARRAALARVLGARAGVAVVDEVEVVVGVRALQHHGRRIVHRASPGG